MHGRHNDDETEQVIDDSVQEPVEESSLWHVFDTFESIVDVKLWSHLDKSKQVDGSHQCIQNIGVPALVVIIEHTVDRVAEHDRVQCVTEVSHCFFVILFGFTLGISIFVFQPIVRELFSLNDLRRSLQLPTINGYTNELWSQNHERCFIVT